MIRMRNGCESGSGGIPRESGDDPILETFSGELKWYSPRERG